MFNWLLTTGPIQIKQEGIKYSHIYIYDKKMKSLPTNYNIHNCYWYIVTDMRSYLMGSQMEF